MLSLGLLPRLAKGKGNSVQSFYSFVLSKDCATGVGWYVITVTCKL